MVTTMPSNLKFPSTVEIKRVLAAAMRGGVEIGTVEIHPRKIIIHPKAEGASSIDAYELWKMAQGKATDRVKLVDEESDALAAKPKR